MRRHAPRHHLRALHVRALPRSHRVASRSVPHYQHGQRAGAHVLGTNDMHMHSHITGVQGTRRHAPQRCWDTQHTGGYLCTRPAQYSTQTSTPAHLIRLVVIKRFWLGFVQQARGERGHIAGGALGVCGHRCKRGNTCTGKGGGACGWGHTFRRVVALGITSVWLLQTLCRHTVNTLQPHCRHTEETPLL